MHYTVSRTTRNKVHALYILVYVPTKYEHGDWSLVASFGIGTYWIKFAFWELILMAFFNNLPAAEPLLVRRDPGGGSFLEDDWDPEDVC